MKKGSKVLLQVNRKILLLSHIPMRDDVADNILGQELSNLGNQVWKIPLLGYVRDKILFLKPDIIVLPEIRCEYTRDLVKSLYEWGVTVVQRRCEHGLTKESKVNDEHTRATFSNWPYSKWVDLDLVWGGKFADMLVASGSMPRKKIKVVGGHGFDQYFLPRPPVQKAKGKTMLFATGFGCAERNPQYSVPEALPTDKMHVEEVERNIKNRKLFGDLIEAFCKRFPKWNVHIRLHPGETIVYYDTRFRDKINKQIKLFPPEPAVMGLTRVDAVVHVGSTLAYEAHLMNKPGLCFMGTTDDAVITKISPTYKTINGILNAVRKLDLRKPNANRKIIKNLEDNYFGVADGKANKRAADTINALPPKSTKIPNEWPVSKEAKYLTKDVFVNMYYAQCAACRGFYYVDGHRETTKCPWCGIANIKAVKPGA